MSKAALKSTLVSISALVLLGFAPAFAGDNAARAKAYFNAIADGNAEAIASFYADDAEFRWIGGPLAGVYKGKSKIRAVWEKFSEAAGKLDHDVLQLSENTAGKGPSITATVKFKGEGEVPVRFAITL
jgi:ketosteroid isomerase-like protein